MNPSIWLKGSKNLRLDHLYPHTQSSQDNPSPSLGLFSLSFPINLWRRTGVYRSTSINLLYPCVKSSIL